MLSQRRVISNFTFLILRYLRQSHGMMLSRLLLVSGALLALLCSWGAYSQDFDPMAPEGGYYRREHSLVQPFQGSGMDVPFWEFRGSTVVTSSYVRLTPDKQSMQGAIWSTVPVVMHNWEMLIHFHVHGQGSHLFGDGFAVWYTKERSESGPIFGSRDYFTGLAVFFDTYSNYDGEHSHEHPYISAMINNGSLHYDHDRDGTHSEIAGCSVKFRNPKYETYAAISYINRQLVILYNVHGKPEWDACFVAKDIDLPTGYYFGITAVTGDLADNHDIISLKVYDIDTINMEEGGTQAEEMDWSTVMPHAKNQEPPRDHVDTAKPLFGPNTYKAISITLIILLVVGVVAVIGGVAFFNNQQKSRKRFF